MSFCAWPDLGALLCCAEYMHGPLNDELIMQARTPRSTSAVSVYLFSLLDLCVFYCSTVAFASLRLLIYMMFDHCYTCTKRLY